MSSINRAHTTLLLNFHRNYLALFLRYSNLFVESRKYYLSHVYLSGSHIAGLPHWNFSKISGVKKLESLGYGSAIYSMALHLSVYPSACHSAWWHTDVSFLSPKISVIFDGSRRIHYKSSNSSETLHYTDRSSTNRKELTAYRIAPLTMTMNDF